jgi:predicted transcriptional regulator
LRSKRTIFDVIADILAILDENNCNKTVLAGRANLDSRSSTNYINMLSRSNLITRDVSSNCFKITERGRDYLEQYRKLKTLLMAAFAMVAVSVTAVH